MDRDATFDSIINQRNALIATLGVLTEDEWNTQALCAGWRVRDVVGHLVSILEIPLGRYLLNVAKARSLDKYADRISRELGARDPQRLLGDFRLLAPKRFALPIIGPIAPLTDIFVHSRDIERPLGRPATLEPGALTAVLDYTCGGKAYGFISSKRTKGLRFEATDLPWSSGQGALVSGPGEAIMMAVTGRRTALADLVGDGQAVLSSRLP